MFLLRRGSGCDYLTSCKTTGDIIVGNSDPAVSNGENLAG